MIQEIIVWCLFFGVIGGTIYRLFFTKKPKDTGCSSSCGCDA